MDVHFYFRVLRRLTFIAASLRKCTCLFIGILFIILTYKASRLKNNTLLGAINNNSSVVASSERIVTYSEDDVFNAIRKIRLKNCLRKYPTGEKCAQIHLCDKFNEMTACNECNVSSGCNSAKVQDKNSEDGCKKRLPKAIIIGTYKSGTRELIDFLAMNPSVVIKRKPHYEVSYFDKYVDKGLTWYKDQMPFSCKQQVTVEKSPGYFYSEEAPRRIFEMDEDIKLILIVRNPVDRTIAHLTFEDFITREQYGNDINNCLYKYVLNRMVINKNCFAIKASLYDTPIERYLEYFSLKQIQIIDAAAFLKNPCKVVKNLEDFLNIERYIDCESFIYNKDKQMFCVQADPASDGPISCYGRNRGREQSETEFSLLKGHLRTLFRPHNKRFFKLVGRHFEWE